MHYVSQNCLENTRCPVSVDLNSNNSNLNSGPKCALFQLKSTCPLFQPKIDVSAFPAKNRRVGFSSGKSTFQLSPPSRRNILAYSGARQVPTVLSESEYSFNERYPSAAPLVMSRRSRACKCIPNL